MPKINVLKQNIANRIAAGEVAQRPASVVKELIENCIDAGADDIVINIKKGGKESICIMDNGEGMTPEDAKLCFLRHATSKIISDQDLFNIGSYGFRGEAIPSIASISLFNLETSTKNSEIGTKIVCEGGSLTSVSECVPINGTKIEVRDLFYNTPARRKFQKSTAVEFNNIFDVVNNQALVSNNISFELNHNNKQILKVNKTDESLQRIGGLYGNSFINEFKKADYSNDIIKITGFVSNASLTRSNRNMQKIFINDRIVKNSTIYSAIFNAYKGLLAARRYPIVFLYIKLPYEFVDVNVHPTKEEVKFKEDALVYSSVLKAVKDTIYDLKGSNELEQQIPNKIETKTTSSEGAEFFSLGQRPRGNPAKETNTTKQIISNGNPAKENNTTKQIISNGNPAKETNKTKQIPKDNAKNNIKKAIFNYHLKQTETPKLKENKYGKNTEYRSQKSEDKENNKTKQIIPDDINISITDFYYFNDLYIITEIDNQLAIFDQHAVHERVLYEKFKSGYEQGNIGVQKLLIPIDIELLPDTVSLFKQMIPELNKLGFEIEEFGKETFLIRAVPVFIKDGSIKQIINDILDEIKELGFSKDIIINRFDEVIKMMACRSAYKAGDNISEPEIKKILSDLFKTQNPESCPHGRPCLVKFNKNDLEKIFKRKK